jgi:hypothetical protein
MKPPMTLVGDFGGFMSISQNICGILVFMGGTLWGCDAQLSRFDKATVKINSAPNSAGTANPAQTGQDIAADPQNPLPTPIGPSGGSQPGAPSSSSSASPEGELPGSDTNTSQTPSDPTTGTPPLPVKANLDLGGDVKTNTTFRLKYKLEANAPHQIQWSKVTGPGNLKIETLGSNEVSIVPNLDGVYTIGGDVIVGQATVASDTVLLTWDTSGPTGSGTPQILADSLAETSSVTVDNDLNLLFKWPEFSDKFSNPVVYSLQVFQGGNCTGTLQEIQLGTNQNQLSYPYDGTAGVTYSFYVTARDSLGNLSNSLCSNNMTIDTTPPPSLDSAAAERGPRVQTVRLLLRLPADVSDYALLEVRRGPPVSTGTPIIPTDCQSGQKVYSQDHFTAGSQLSIDDDIGKAGYFVGYRVCVWDQAGNKSSDILIDKDSGSVTPPKSKEHIIFVTEDIYKGNLGGPSGGKTGLELADLRCQSAGLAATNPPAPAQSSYVTGEVRWKALLSDESNDAKQRIIISGSVRDQADQTIIADSRSDLWDGSIATSIFFNQNGLTAGMAWTGSDRYGMRTNHHCNNWSSNLADFGYQGDSYSASDFNWFSAEPPFAASLAACSDELSLYCVSQPQTIVWASPVITSHLGTGLELSIKKPDTNYQNVTIEVWRMDGLAPPDLSCLQKTTELKLNTFNYSNLPPLWTDTSVNIGTTYSYRICLKDDLGNVLASQTTSEIYQ